MAQNAWWKICPAISAAVGALSLFAAAPASATPVPNQEYVFTGTCGANDCVGYGVGELYLLGTYVPGTSITPYFVRWDYSSSILSYSITTPILVSGVIPVGLPSTASIDIEGQFNGDGYIFNSSTNGSWSILVGLPDNDHGTVSVWAAAPEPATLAVLGSALGGLGLIRRRRRA